VTAGWYHGSAGTDHSPTVKAEAAAAVVELMMMGVRTPETVEIYINVQIINLRNCCI
jgi:hypothetical protein